MLQELVRENAVNVFEECGFGVFQLTENEAVAAHNAIEALTFYAEQTGTVPEGTISQLSLDDPFDYVDELDSAVRTVTNRQLINEAIRDNLHFPCFLITWVELDATIH
jgi:hypothetical protein